MSATVCSICTTRYSRGPTNFSDVNKIRTSYHKHKLKPVYCVSVERRTRRLGYYSHFDRIETGAVLRWGGGNCFPQT